VEHQVRYYSIFIYLLVPLHVSEPDPFTRTPHHQTLLQSQTNRVLSFILTLTLTLTLTPTNQFSLS
jgi:hypothetical protein